MDPQVAKKIEKKFSSYRQHTYPKGQIIIFAGDDPEYVYFLVKGKVRQYDVSYRGDEVIVNIFKPKAFFPMSWALNRTHNRYFFKTEEATTVHLVPADDAVSFMKSNPDITLDLLARVYKGVDGVLERVVHLMSGTAKSRLIYELLIECKRFGAKNSKGAYILDTNETDIAARSGLSRETVSREMHKLKKQGLVSVTRSGVTVKDLVELEKILGREL